MNMFKKNQGWKTRKTQWFYVALGTFKVCAKSDLKSIAEVNIFLCFVPCRLSGKPDVPFISLGFIFEMH